MSKELETIYRRLGPGARILDVGCFGFRQVEFSRSLEIEGLHHFGVDYNDYQELPEGFVYRRADLNHDPLPFEDDFFDCVVASHIIEHLSRPVEFFGECIRICKPGGFVHLEAPSERSILLPGMPFAHEKFFSTSFFDDPTHTARPWSPQAFHRLTRYYGCQPITTGYRTSWKQRLLLPLTLPYALLTRNGRMLERVLWLAVGWASFATLQKPGSMHGAPPFTYFIPTDR
jgi:SAM-dependent methyltransferase